MPCDSEYMRPSEREKESQKTAKCLVYLFKQINIPCSDWIVNAARSIYGAPSRLDDMVVILCDLCTKMTEHQRNIIIYDGKNKDARKLADWWDDHQEADRKRKERESSGQNQALQDFIIWLKGFLDGNISKRGEGKE